MDTPDDLAWAPHNSSLLYTLQCKYEFTNAGLRLLGKTGGTPASLCVRDREALRSTEDLLEGPGKGTTLEFKVSKTGDGTVAVSSVGTPNDHWVRNTPYFGALPAAVAFRYLEEGKMKAVPPVYMGSLRDPAADCSGRPYPYDAHVSVRIIEYDAGWVSALPGQSGIELSTIQGAEWAKDSLVASGALKGYGCPVVLYGAMGSLNEDGHPVLFCTPATAIVPCPRKVLILGDDSYKAHPALWGRALGCAQGWLDGDGAQACSEGWALRAQLEWGAPAPQGGPAYQEDKLDMLWWSLTHDVMLLCTRARDLGRYGAEQAGCAGFAWDLRAKIGLGAVAVDAENPAAAARAADKHAAGDLYGLDMPRRTSAAALEISRTLEQGSSLYGLTKQTLIAEGFWSSLAPGQGATHPSYRIRYGGTDGDYEDASTYAEPEYVYGEGRRAPR